PAVRLDELRSQFAFQSVDLLPHGRLGQSQRCGRSRETAFPRCLVETAELLERQLLVGRLTGRFSRHPSPPVPLPQEESGETSYRSNLWFINKELPALYDCGPGFTTVRSEQM